MRRPAQGGGARNNAPASVTLAPVRAERVSQKLEALGNARANESVDISTKISNIVTAVRFRDGERVKRGQVLVQLDDAQARADVAAAQATLTESESQYNRSRELLDTQALSKSSFDQLEGTLKANRARLGAATARLEDTVIRAPFSGRVGLRRVSVGTLISPGDVITTLDDTSVIKLDFSVPENFLASLREGLSIRATAPAYPGRTFAGSVAQHRFARRHDHALGDRARAAGQRRRRAQARHVPQRQPGERRTRGAGHPRRGADARSRAPVRVRGGGRQGARAAKCASVGRRPGSVEVLAGLTAGERVVVEGTQKVRDGALVRAIERARGGCARRRRWTSPTRPARAPRG